MNPEDTNSGAQSGESHVNPSDATTVVDPGTASSTAATKAAIDLAELNQRLGKSFPDVETALKSIVDTNSYVGRKKEDIEKEVLAKVQNTQETDKLSKEIAEMRKDNFYRDNPDYAKPEIRALIDKFGGNPAEVINDATFKTIFEKTKGFDEVQSRRTVLDSSPRLASSQDTLTKAREALNGGARMESVEDSIAEAVLALSK